MSLERKEPKTVVTTDDGISYTKLPKLSSDQMQLLAMLRYRRPHGSKTEEQFIDKYIILPLNSIKKNWFKDGFGNIHVHVPYLRETPEDEYCLFSAHTDTVHKTGGEQTVLVTEAGVAYTSNKGSKGQAAFGQCLGADDATGCWILMNMLNRGIPGYYIFHRAEERGGRGSAFIRDNFLSLIKPKIKLAIAFDRKGTNEVITHQSGSRGASDACANLLIAELAKYGVQMVKSQGGTFTDTAHYFYRVSECFNMSVGYHKQHGPNETQDLMFAEKLLNALYRVDWKGLKTFRDHTSQPMVIGSRGYQYEGEVFNVKMGASVKDLPVMDAPMIDDILTEDNINDIINERSLPLSKEGIQDLIDRFPEVVVDWLYSLNISEEDVLDTMKKINPAVAYALKLQEDILTRDEDTV